MNRFMVVVLDGFGIGAMDDVPLIRPQDIGSNTCLHILNRMPGLRLDSLESLGLINALGAKANAMDVSEGALFGQSELMHTGADTFWGHHEIMGTLPRKPRVEPFSAYLEPVMSALIEAGHRVRRYGNGLDILIVDDRVTIGDNLESDAGQNYNVTAGFDQISFEDLSAVGSLVRNLVPVSRVITFGGEGVGIGDLLKAYSTKSGLYAGVKAPESGVYRRGYRVVHFGYGIDPALQVPNLLAEGGYPAVLIGKVADIVENKAGKSIPGVDTAEVLENTLREMERLPEGFICTNVQETDLAGHSEDAERYAEVLQVADRYLCRIMEGMDESDILIVTADHGNDPTIGHPHHTRERVPLLIYTKEGRRGYIGLRKTLSDIGATVCDFFRARRPENGISFLSSIRRGA